MFGIGLTEMILIGLVILLLFSPRELPGMIKSVAKVYGSIRRTAEDFRAQVMEAEELREPIEEIRAAYHGTKQELQSAQDLARRELQRARSETMKAQQKLTELVREESRRKDPTPSLPPASTSTPAASTSTPAASTSTPSASAPATNKSSAPANTSSAPASPLASATPIVPTASAVPTAAPVPTAAVPTASPVPTPTSRPPVPGAVASSRPFAGPGAPAEPQDPPANDRSDAA